MYFTASVQLYDALDQVMWVAQVREWDENPSEDHSEVVYRLSGSLPGEGLSNPTRWLKRALEDIRESM